MADVRSIKTSFAAGELSPTLLGRADLRAYGNGARSLRNVFIQSTGGLTRRPGLRHITTLPGPARLLPFEFNTEQTYLIALTSGLMQVFIGDSQVAAVAAPWTDAMLPQLAWTQSADTLLVCHPQMPPVRITRTSNTSWTVSTWPWLEFPMHRFAPGAVTLTPGGLSGSITLTASAPVFDPLHTNIRIRVGGKRVDITGVASSTAVVGTVIDTLTSLNPTTDWEETALSQLHGWPTTVCFHQDRLVVGGSRDLPNRLFLSQTGDLFNFSTGTGLDDQAISFGLMSDQVNAIRGVFSGRNLQVFTSGGEWMVSGEPLTPASIQLTRQTRIGSQVARLVQPVDVDGSTIFASRTGRSIYEFTYTDVQQAYQANDLALVAAHLIHTPVALAYDQLRRLLHVAMEDGSLATLTVYRTEQVIAWTAQETQGLFRSLAEIEGVVYAAVERAGSTRLERLDDTLALDAALTGSAAIPQKGWSGLTHLEGQTVGVLADGAPRPNATVVTGAVTLDDTAGSVQIGLRFRHVVEPLPPELLTPLGARAAPLRLISITFRLLDTAALAVDVGRGPEPVPFRRLDTPLLDAPPARFTGDARMRALGWRRDAMKPLWRIEDDTPLPLTLLSVTTEMRITD